LNELILIISQNHVVAQNLIEIHSNIIHVKFMSENDALTLLKIRISINKSSDVDKKTLIQTLKYILLVITQADTYI